MRGPGYNTARALAEVREHKIREWAHFRKYFSRFNARLRGPGFVDQILPVLEIKPSQGDVTCERKTSK
jgi:hypothetical protein